MSGSNALAAAKRRRGGSDSKGPSPPGSINTSNNPPGPAAQLNPLQLVAINHQRLNKLADELPKSIDMLGENFNALSSNCDYLHEQFGILEKMVETVMSNQNSTKSNTSSVVNSVSVDVFDRLNKDVDEVHKVISRMQSFTMDLSNTVNKTKDNLDAYVNNVNNLTLNVEKFNKKVDLIEQTLNDRLDTLEHMFENIIKPNNPTIDAEV